MQQKDLQNLLESCKINTETIIKPLEKMISIYKFIIAVLIVCNILTTSVFCYYIKTIFNNSRLSNRAYVTSMNKIMEKCTHVERSNVRVD